ncbi:putative repressor of comG operon [Bacillus cereus]|nr:putative repressor of comG operon [Bacillus cereus]
MNEKSMQFLQIAMKHLPEAKAILDDNGIALDMEKAQPVLELLMKVMNEAYELGFRLFLIFKSTFPPDLTFIFAKPEKI